MTPAHIKMGMIETHPDFIDLTVCLASTGYPVVAFSVNRADLIARLQRCPVSTVDQLTLSISVPPETTEKHLEATIFE